MIKNANAVMANVPAMDVKRENPATATVIVPAVKKNAAALNKIDLPFLQHKPYISGVFCLWDDVGSFLPLSFSMNL